MRCSRSGVSGVSATIPSEIRISSGDDIHKYRPTTVIQQGLIPLPLPTCPTLHRTPAMKFFSVAAILAAVASTVDAIQVNTP